MQCTAPWQPLQVSHLSPDGSPLNNSESEDGVRARGLRVHVGGGDRAGQCTSPQALAGLQGDTNIGHGPHSEAHRYTNTS